MQDFFCAVPSEMNYPILARRTRYFKEDEMGVSKLSEITQELIDEGEMKGKIDVIIEMLKDNQPINIISKFTKFTVEKIKEIAKQNDIAVTE